ncbi:hypothetical protein Vretimale_7829 [Volvox reticuliferus]|uniref:AMP-dependent synthetase/ligase domain-containing protein n=1 Tax=Volvox reticuliferus TaxID=1737510 RepID=A0A8J4LN59_9CHLO|nr:hypothetical protein Vretifemale_4928 [Volvox reticuliferus]GIM03020.1 hypothetical protein Vretimale_7829 [Volvox reticuliferus]
MQNFAAGLQELGVTKHDKVALFSENSSRWLVADSAIMACGAAGVVRGASAPPEELLYIAQHSSATVLVVQDGAALSKLLAASLAHEQAQVGDDNGRSEGEHIPSRVAMSGGAGQIWERKKCGLLPW